MAMIVLFVLVRIHCEDYHDYDHEYDNHDFDHEYDNHDYQNHDDDFGDDCLFFGLAFIAWIAASGSLHNLPSATFCDDHLC